MIKQSLCCRLPFFDNARYSDDFRIRSARLSVYRLNEKDPFGEGWLGCCLNRASIKGSSSVIQSGWQSLSTPSAPTIDNTPAGLGWHSFSESVSSGSFDSAGLVSTFHGLLSFFSMGKANDSHYSIVESGTLTIRKQRCQGAKIFLTRSMCILPASSWSRTKFLRLTTSVVDRLYYFKRFHMISTVWIDNDLLPNRFFQPGYQSVLFTVKKLGDFRVHP